MVTPYFLGKIATIPYVAVRTLIEYYTVGTVYQKTSSNEFGNSLWKNLHLSIEYHLSGSLQKSDVKTFAYSPLSKVFQSFEKNKHPLLEDLNNFAKPLDKYSYWISESEGAENVLIYIHGGGYLLGMFEAQLVGFMALYYALSPEIRKKTSFLIVDYSLTLFDHVFPTQLWETLSSYKTLVDNGYKNIHLFGESAGAHLALTLSRYVAYPEEAQEIFSKFPQFDFSSFKNLPQPVSLVLESPWVQPCTQPILPPPQGQNIYGDLGALDTSMGDYYVEGIDKEIIKDFLTFTQTNYDDHWSKVQAITSGKTIVLYGEREVLRDAIQKFHGIINKNDNVSKYMEVGGIHSALVYVESLDFISTEGAQKAVQGDFEKKFAYTTISKFYGEVI
ncbi:Arylacetamide deacetylase [Scheffersomyces amazonensis]|uniref:Arylacetamide deacetylase n=1 Tax=Scheffersomyces amazonensis TaxID=1078765 RepID=UPI00315DF319